MDLAPFQAAARRAMPDVAWNYYQATADPGDSDADADAHAWAQFDVVPRVLRGAGLPDTAVTLPESAHRGGATLGTPIMVSPTAAHGLAHPDAEPASGSGAAEVGALMVCSSSATTGVGTFGATMPGPWWAQVYLHRDRARSNDYLDRAVAAGAGAIVLTVDLAPPSDAPFRKTVQSQLTIRPGNFPDLTWPQLSALYELALRPSDVGEIASRTGLPVWVKGVLHPDDAVRALDAGAAGVIVSNHGRRQVAGVIPTADALGPVVRAVAGRAPVLVDGGIRSGVDVLRALALGATLVGVGRPALWALAAGGADGVSALLGELTAELAQAMAATGATTPADVNGSMVRRR